MNLNKKKQMNHKNPQYNKLHSARKAEIREQIIM